MHSVPCSSACWPTFSVGLYRLETLPWTETAQHTARCDLQGIPTTGGFGACTFTVTEKKTITFSTSSAYADRPGFRAWNVSWVNLGVSVQKQYSKISNGTNHFAHTKPILQITSFCANGSQLKPLSNQLSTATQTLNTALAMELGPKKNIFKSHDCFSGAGVQYAYSSWISDNHQMSAHSL